MANLKTFSGFSIQNKSTDPTPYAQALVDNPYVGAWASGGNLNQARDTMGSSTFRTLSLIHISEPTRPY